MTPIFLEKSYADLRFVDDEWDQVVTRDQLLAMCAQTDIPDGWSVRVRTSFNDDDGIYTELVTVSPDGVRRVLSTSRRWLEHPVVVVDGPRSYHNQWSTYEEALRCIFEGGMS